MQAIKIYNDNCIKRREDKSGFSEKCYKLTISKDNIEVVQVNRDISNTFFSQIKYYNSNLIIKTKKESYI